jgi:NMD protein affecting ribosome stability and mRNA decay
MAEEEKTYECLRCGRKIKEKEYETYDGLCEDCYEIETDELDCEDGY